MAEGTDIAGGAVRASPEKEAGERSPVEQVIDLIRKRLPGDITLTEAAAAVHLNASYLSQLFKQRMNRTFVDYVLQVRMDEAERLLRHTSLRISEIAERLGYSDISGFSHTFKRLKGRSPSEFRKTLGNEETDQTRSVSLRLLIRRRLDLVLGSRPFMIFSPVAHRLQNGNQGFAILA
ncbi:AraC family transcriptional regulator [Paenibacillus sp. CC-CFT747]|nr:AraC family transcriptional regulator [Paenibacillus sp. CC-CFT747]